MNAWLYLYFPDMYLHSLVHDSHSPVVVITQDQQRVIQVSTAAKQRGIRSDMPLTSALFLCPEIICHTLNQEYAEQLLQQRALWAYRYSAQIFPDPAEGLWLEAGSMLKLFGGIDAFVNTLRDSCEQHRWPLKYGLGLTPVSARWQALADVKTLSLNPEQQQHALQTLTLDELHLNDAQLLALQRLGIQRLGELLQLPLAETGRRICPQLMQQLQQLYGHQKPPSPLFAPPLKFSEKVIFSHDAEHQNGLFFPLARLLDSLCGFLHHHQLSVRWLALRLLHREPPETRWLFSFASHEHRYEELLQLCRYQLDKQSLRAPVTELQLSVTQFTSRQQEQASCLTSDAPKAHSASLINRLQARLSASQVSVLQSTGDPRPEASWQAQPADEHLPDNLARTGDWPTWLLPEPIPYVSPAQVIRGPMRISSGWWDSRMTRRDYYQVMHDEQLLWVFRDDQKRWFLHGYFS
jgi:protein ImuB